MFGSFQKEKLKKDCIPLHRHAFDMDRGEEAKTRTKLAAIPSQRKYN